MTEAKKLVMAEKELTAVARVLLNALEQGAEKGEYRMFPPHKVEIYRRGKICFETKNGVPDLRESLRRLGVTLYHLASGESEHSRESFTIDGYNQKPLETKLWPVVSFLLSGNACSIPQVQKELDDIASWKGEALKTMWENWRLAKGITGRIVGVLWRFFVRMVKFPALWMRRNQSVIQGTVAGILAVLCVAEIVWYWSFNWPFSDVLGLVVLTFLFVVAVCILFFAEDSPLDILGDVFSFLRSACVVGAMALYAMLSFWAPLMGAGGAVSDYGVLVDRTSGEFVARLPLKDGNAFLGWEKNTINHFKYRVVPGVPARGSFPKRFTILDGARKFELPVNVSYAVQPTKEDFVFVWRTWKDKEGLEKAINASLDALGEKLNGRFSQLNANLTIRHGAADLLFDLNLVENEQKKTQEALRSFLEAESRSVFPRVVLSIAQ